MPLTIGSNIASLRAQQSLSSATRNLTKVYERLSSGLRINNASDDPAGLAVAQSLKSDSKVFTQGVRNLNDGISALTIADSAISELTGIVSRLKELAGQAANGSYSKTQRSALDTEAQALKEEFFRISSTTKYNGINLLNGSTQSIALQAGYGINGYIAVDSGGVIGTGSFSVAGSYATGGSTVYGVSVGDVNGDGISDIVATNSNNAITVSLGIGDGSFAASVSYAAAIGVLQEVKLGDLNNDGVLDAVAVGNGGYAAVLIGSGNGSFTTVQTYAQNAVPTLDVALADINNDGYQDLVTTGADQYTTVRLGSGNGTFGTSVSYQGGGGAVALGDINNDGILDLASGTIGGNVAVRLGVGGGVFGAVTTYAAEGSSTYGVSLTDLNRDGYLDLISSGLSPTSTTSLTVRYGSASGAFGAASSYLTYAAVGTNLTTGDLNGDGYNDIVVSGSTAISVLLSNGSGGFNSVVTVSSGQSVDSLELGDFNRDGVLDIAAARIGTANGLQVFLGQTQNGTAPLMDFSLKTQADAKQAINAFTDKLTQLSLQRGEIGSFQSRLGYAVSHLSAVSANYLEAESRIRDADIATDAAEMIRGQILQQSGAAVLAQANQQPSLVLKLLASD